MHAHFFRTLPLLLAVVQPGWAAEPVAPQDKAPGFIDGSHLGLNLRHYYSNQHTQRSTHLVIKKHGVAQPTRERDTWVQTGMLNYSSGYTQGLVGFGVDASLFSAVTLERGHGAVANGGDRVLVDSDGDAVPSWSRLGVGDLRLRVSSTELKAGRMLTENPVLRYKDNRALPSTFQGIALNSNELDWLALQAGSFERAIPRTGTGSERLTTTFGNRAYSGSRISYLGATAKSPYGLTVSAYGSRFEDMWQQYYLGATHLAGDRTHLALKTSLNYYRTRDQGEQHLGFIDNDAYSLAVTASHGAHGLTAAWQQVFGDEYFDYVWESTGNYMANSLYSDYNGPNEKSWQLRYDLDFAAYGIPGLTASLWHAKGWGIDGSHYNGDRDGRNTGYNVRGLDGAKHNENGLMLAYVVQSGALKNAVLRSIVYNHRESGGQIDGSYDEFRLVANVPFTLF
ncbi:outer membrane porin, OprD family [Pseudomonas prosekii]|uniref:Outer membrane porin, OprD family n=1 Tax=Pseudomonas prosekii TaxID=1148509 RepID=A0A3L8CDA4_9PSED|nr:OprD family outer membrane porin [Pseudomonas prosekii]RLU05908.1 outer membrane porin, OprD family [Pseudomonas prosekii]RLU06132.1 outer membrane porin, OprD family [Pseudomonas prosekii]